MELAAEIEPLLSPLSPFLPTANSEWIEDCQSSHTAQAHANTSELIWDTSSLNPCNRLCHSDPVSSTRWRIDGCTAMGRQFHALPIYLFPNIAPRGIDVIIPCQSRHPRHLRVALGSSEVFGMSTKRVRKLGISEYIVQALSSWSARQPYFDEIYRALPYGSKIVFENIVPFPSQPRIRIVPDNTWSERLLPIETLRDFWKLPPNGWPASIHMNSLEVVFQINENVALVRAPEIGGSTPFIFKTNVRSMKHFYHELKLLLTMENYPGITSKPLRVVICNESGIGSSRDMVAGFLSEYYPGGNLRDVLESNSPMASVLQLKWSIQIVETLQHIRNSPARFYSDLKPDNLVISGLARDIIFIDFEQAGNWDTFQPPETFYLTWMEKLSARREAPEERRKQYKSLLDLNIPHPGSKE